MTEDILPENSLQEIERTTKELAFLIESDAILRYLPEDKAKLLASAITAVRAPALALRAAQRPKYPGPSGRQQLVKQLKNVLARRGLKGGRILEISGAWDRTYERGLPEFKFDYVEIFPKPGDKTVVLADAINLAPIKSESYDVVISHAVFEHLSRPWMAAREIERVLKIGGVTQHVAPFSMPYHGAPDDFYRYTKSGMRQLFNGLECLYSYFWGPYRRLNIRGTTSGGRFVHNQEQSPEFKDDTFGGWREAWHVVYGGVKLMNGDRTRAVKAAEQLIVDSVYAMWDRGEKGWPAFKAAEELLARVALDLEGRLLPRVQVADADAPPTAQQIWHVWRRKSRDRTNASTHVRFLLRNHLS